MADDDKNKDVVPVDAIARTPIEIVQPEKFQKNEDPLTGVVDPNLPHHLGAMGKFVGGGPEKAGNIATIVIGIGALMILGGGVASAETTNTTVAPTLDKLVTGGLSLISGALGYIFGASKTGN